MCISSLFQLTSFSVTCFFLKMIIKAGYGNFSTNEGFSFPYRYEKSGFKSVIISGSLLFHFDKSELPVDHISIKWARTFDIWSIIETIKNYDQVIFVFGGDDLSEHPKKYLSKKLKTRKAGTPEEVASELKALASRVFRPAICSIPFRVGLDDAIPEINYLLISNSDAYVFIGLAKQLHRVNETPDGVHLSNAQLGNFKAKVGHRLFGWKKKFSE